MRSFERGVENRRTFELHSPNDSVIARIERDVGQLHRRAEPVAKEPARLVAVGERADAIREIVRAGARVDAQLRHVERAERAVAMASDHQLAVTRNRRVQRLRRHAETLLNVDLVRERENVDVVDRKRFGVGEQFGHLRRTRQMIRGIELSEQRHDSSPQAAASTAENFGITLRANSSRLASTSACGIVSFAFSRKFTQSMPVLSHSFNVAIS